MTTLAIGIQIAPVWARFNDDLIKLVDYVPEDSLNWSPMLGGRLALITVLAWLAIAALGAPVLADGSGGWRAVTGHTMGFLAGMAAAAFVCGRACERTAGVLSRTAVFLGGHVIVLAVGWSGMISFMSPASAFEYGILPFIPGALIKSIAAALTLRLFSR